MNLQDFIYLDYASTCPRNADIIAARTKFEQSSYANVGRASYNLAESSMIAYEESKKAVARWIGCEPVEVLYTYSTTYAINLLALALEQNKVVGKGDTILLSVSEHHANIVPWQMIAHRLGANIKFVHLDNQYRIDLDDLYSKLDDSVRVVSFQYASNVTGAIHPLENVRAIIGPERFFCIDAAQMVLHGPLDMKKLGCDAMVFSGHKMMADTGIGVLALWKVLQKSWDSPISGGGAINFVHQDGYEQAGIPDRWEPGTPHITGAVTLKYALDYLQNMDTEKRKNYHNCIQFVTDAFQKLAPKVRVFHSDSTACLGIWSFTVGEQHSNDIADAFNDKKIYVRSGHHCCEPLHAYFGVSGTVRMSIAYDTTIDELRQFFAVLETLL